MDWLFSSQVPQKTNTEKTLPNKPIREVSSTLQSATLPDMPRHSTSMIIEDKNETVKKTGTRKPEIHFYEQSSGEGISLFGKTINQNQKAYKKQWTEKEHEKEIQELILQKEKLGGMPPIQPKHHLKNWKSFNENPDEIIENEEKKVFLNENNDTFYIIKEAKEYMEKMRDFIKQMVKNENFMFFPIKPQPSEIAPEIESELQKYSQKYENAKKDIEKLSSKNSELKRNLEISEENLVSRIQEITKLKNTLQEAEKEIMKRGKIIQNLSREIEENRKFASIDYAIMRKKLYLKEQENANFIAELSKEKQLRIELEDFNKSLTQKLQDRTMSTALIDQSVNTEFDSSEIIVPQIPEKNLISQLISKPNIVTSIVKFLTPKEASNMLISSKLFNSSMIKNPAVWIHIIIQTNKSAQKSLQNLEKIITKLKNDDKRFNFLKKIKISTDPEFNRLVDEYICKKKQIGSSLLKPLTESRNFIYTGETQKKAPIEKKPDMQTQQSGFFSGLASVFSLVSEQTNIPGTMQKPMPSISPPLDDENDTLEVLSNSDKHISPETICGLLNKMAARIGSSQPDKMNRWLNQLQLCFGMLFKACIQFYLEAKDLEKLKNFLVDRLDGLKEKMKNEKIKEETRLKEIENIKDVFFNFCKNIDA